MADVEFTTLAQRVGNRGYAASSCGDETGLATGTATGRRSILRRPVPFTEFTSRVAVDANARPLARLCH